jgi:hypothetical protein
MITSVSTGTERADFSGRALHAVMNAVKREWLDERPIQSLLRDALQHVPGFAADLFDERPETIGWAHADQNWADLLGYDRDFGKRGVHVTHVIEVKTAWKTHERADERVQFDAYYAEETSQDAVFFVVGPDDAGPEYRHIADSTERIHRWMRDAGVRSPHVWRVVTFNQIRDWLAESGFGAPSPANAAFADFVLSLVRAIDPNAME